MKQALVVAAALVAAACSPPLMKLPGGPGTPLGAPDVESALMQATAQCLRVRTLTAEVAVSGSAGGHRLRGRLSAGVAEPASARLEAVSPFGAPFFMFVAVGDDATLLLPRDERVLQHGRPAQVLEAVTGIPLGTTELEALLTGCLTPAEPSDLPANASQLGATWIGMRTMGGDQAYVHRDTANGPWTLVATVRGFGTSGLRWRAEYADRQNGIPRFIRLTSMDEKGRTGLAFDLRLALSQIDVDTPLGADVFTIQVPRSAMPITLEQLRQSGVFGAP